MRKNLKVAPQDGKIVFLGDEIEFLEEKFSILVEFEKRITYLLENNYVYKNTHNF